MGKKLLRLLKNPPIRGPLEHEVAALQRPIQESTHRRVVGDQHATVGGRVLLTLRHQDEDTQDKFKSVSPRTVQLAMRSSMRAPKEIKYPLGLPVVVGVMHRLLAPIAEIGDPLLRLVG